MSNIFKNATKKKYRFNFHGAVSVEDLWDLNVESLDTVYKELMRQKKAGSEESLLTATTEDLELSEKIEIVKEIVTDKLAAKERAVNAAKKRAKNQRILEIMADKQDAALRDKSIEELQAMLEEE